MIQQPLIYTIGHSTHSINGFTDMLLSFNIKQLADIRRFPGSKKYPHFNHENLEESLKQANISYRHIEALGGRRKPDKDSKNTVWKNTSFRGYADYMETPEFKKAAGELEDLASRHLTVYLCSEAVWWRCHRSMVSDFLKAKGWNVLHIMSKDKLQEHVYTSPARIVNGHVFYSDIQHTLDLFNGQ